MRTGLNQRDIKSDFTGVQYIGQGTSGLEEKGKGNKKVPVMLLLFLLEIQGWAEHLLWPPLTSTVLAVETGRDVSALDKNIQHHTCPGLTPISHLSRRREILSQSSVVLWLSFQSAETELQKCHCPALHFFFSQSSESFFLIIQPAS